MKLLSACAALIAVSAPSLAVAQTASDWLCITDQATGFSDAGGAWRSVNFKPGDRYIIKRSQTAGVAWEVKEFGKPSLFPVAICTADFNSRKWLNCIGLLTEFKFNANTGRFLKAYIAGYWTYTPGDAVMGKEGGDTPSLEIGTCSTL